MKQYGKLMAAATFIAAVYNMSVSEISNELAEAKQIAFADMKGDLCK